MAHILEASLPSPAGIESISVLSCFVRWCFESRMGASSIFRSVTVCLNTNGGRLKASSS